LLVQDVAAKYAGKVAFVSENFGASKLADQFGVKGYPAVFVDDVLVAAPRDFGYFGEVEGSGRYAPWRNAANGSALVKALERAVDFRVRPLSSEEEAELAYSGALALTPVAVEPVGVCDVGGGSTQLAVGSSAGPAWLRSVELGSLRFFE